MDEQRVTLSTGVSLDVWMAGPEDGPPLILLHGFPESHRTWRHQIAALSDTYRVIAPDQRGYVSSDKPDGVESYTPEKIVADIFALADALGIGNFALAGHDWGGAIAWVAALNNQTRVSRLIIANAPHPFIFQKSLFDDMGQRAASQYIRAFRDPGCEAEIATIGFPKFLAKNVGSLANSNALTDLDRIAYAKEWAVPGAVSAMLNWYRATPMIVPAMDEVPERPAFLDGPFPKLTMPVLVLWGMKDRALLPCQLEGLGALIDDMTLVEIDAEHFIPWEAPAAVTAAMRDWLGRH